jgi:hypothetical protein
MRRLYLAIAIPWIVVFGYVAWDANQEYSYFSSSARDWRDNSGLAVGIDAQSLFHWASRGEKEALVRRNRAPSLHCPLFRSALQSFGLFSCGSLAGSAASINPCARSGVGCIGY